MQWLTSICITLTLASLTHTASAGVVIGGTRVIYDTARKDSSFSVSNTGTSEPYLIQSWVENLHDSNKAPFIITPPLFRLDADQENTLRIIHTGGQLPADKESAFWVNVKTISASEKSDSNQLQISVKSRIKVFYRPTGLPGDATEAYKALTFTRQGRQLKVNNPTPYHVSFFHVRVGDKEIQNAGMVAPQKTLSWEIPPDASGPVSWQAINDYGGVSPTASAALQ